MKQRIEALRAKFEKEEIDGILITAPENRMYLSGFTGTAAVLFITTAESYLLTDFRYIEQARQQSPDFQIVNGHPLEVSLKEIIQKTGTKRIGIEKDHITYSQFVFYQEKLEQAQIIPVKNLVEDLRMIKDEEEISHLRKAIQLADDAFEHILSYIRPGVSEIEISLEMEFFMRKAGATKAAFDFIVASGERSSMPHGVASEKKLQLGELVTMDYGCVYKGYHSDITRTVVLGEAEPRQIEIYNIVLDAQKAAIDAVKPGLKGSNVDKVARDIINKYGFKDNFGHGLGHSVGLEIHEQPSFSPREELVIEKGMTITVEPGIYLPGWGGVRIEDIVLVTDKGSEILTRADKNLLQLNT